MLAGHHATRLTVAAFVVGAVALVGFGTGYRATRALTNDDSAWLRKGDTIVHINGPSARYDAVVADKPVPVAASASDPLEVVQEPDGQVYTADPLTHRVYQIDLDGMTPVPGPNGTSVLAAGNVAYIVDRGNRTLTSVNPRTMAPGATIRIPGEMTGQAIAPSGTAYVGEADGTVTTVTAGKAVTVPVAPRRSALEVTVVGSEPVAVDVTDGRLYPLTPAGRPTLSITIPGGAGQPYQVPTSLPGQEVWLVRGSQLIGIDLATDQAEAASLPSGDTFGSPVVNAGRVFVPDDTAGQVLEFEASGLAALPRIPVPAGASGVRDIEAFARDGEVWVDNPSSEDAAVVNAGGAITTIDKGTGNQVVNPLVPAPHRPTAAPARSRAAAAGSPGPGARFPSAASRSAAPSAPAPATPVAPPGSSAASRPPAPPTPPRQPPAPTTTTRPARAASPPSTTTTVRPTTSTTRLIPVPAPGPDESPPPTAPGCRQPDWCAAFQSTGAGPRPARPPGSSGRPVRAPAGGSPPAAVSSPTTTRRPHRPGRSPMWCTAILRRPARPCRTTPRPWAASQSTWGRRRPAPRPGWCSSRALRPAPPWRSTHR